MKKILALILLSVMATLTQAQGTLVMTGIGAVAPRATLNSSIDYQIVGVSGGTVPYVWSITGGALPTGLTLASSTGRVSGVPTVSGTYFFALRVTDAAGACLNAIVGFTVQAVDGTVGPNFAWGNPVNRVRTRCN